jgi:hypothetical protein
VGKREIWVHKRLVLTGTVQARRRIKMCSPGTTLARAESRLPRQTAPHQGIIRQMSDFFSGLIDDVSPLLRESVLS